MDTDTQNIAQDHCALQQAQILQRGFAPFPAYQPCAQCITACATQCNDACPVPEITSQCTDQCVIVPCDDPTHAAPEDTCGPEHPGPRCGPNSTGPNCVNSPGFEEMLQCCTDYHSYFHEEKPYETIPEVVNWDTSLADFLCGCNESQQAASNPHANLDHGFANPISRSATIHSDYLPSASSTSASDTSTFPSPALAPVTPFLPSSVSHALPSPLSASQPCQCMWANCGAVFSSLSDLVGHVNLQHLRIPPAPQPSTLMDPSFGIDSLSCQWGDCTAYPSPSSIPGSSTGNLHDSATCILATHLLNDHLGIHNHEPFSGNVPVTAQTQAPAFPDPVESLASPPASLNSASHSPSPSPHECSGTHICHWKSCSESFSSCDELTAHITAVHIGSGKPHYDCFWEGCTRHGENGFTSKQKISRHLQSHTGHRPFQCTVCKQNFSEAATLQQHMRRHTQEKPYVCDFPGCGKAFAITGALTIHKRTHNGHKPFKCTYCERAFAESSNLSKHLRTHTGARPYTCTADGCGKAFARPDQLARHMSVHRKKGGGPKV